ncbi:putative membrane protein C3B8.06 [Colletotrichum tanaceti]|uniref:Putative membrane protein C3B8.06 n=1 Tax=Colletotrichum tanaceti TaxID=1306861 RepID=A0A4U6XVG1_9PEZI|nr:putative membrane protein C3B8.06 [Colletotrichum tanaceti]TKW60027.1 putative membrane protein C3B8.06 [Colletotrichum tanaceti]
MNLTIKQCVAVVALGIVPLALAHSAQEDGANVMNMDMDMSHGADEPNKPDTDNYPPTYFALADHAGVMYAHIGVMVLAWVFVLPVAVMLSIARSRYTLALQFAFLAVNALGVLLGTVYNAATPDLYPNNAHHKLGWLVTWIVSVQVLIGLLGMAAGAFKGDSHGAYDRNECQSFIPVSTAAMAEHHRIHGSRLATDYRLSNDSGQGTEPCTESLRSHSRSSSSNEASPRVSGDHQKEFIEDDQDREDGPPMSMPSNSGNQRKANTILAKVAAKISLRVWKGLLYVYNLVDRIVLPLGSVTLCLGIVVYGRFFEGNGIFSGLAHWVKGGIFFWLGLLTLGRWTGSFGEIGWAWNVRPKRDDGNWRPSAEFVESALIFAYGSTNIFLEHLGNWGGEYSAQDLEHISITVLFIGGGLVGMLIESTRVRDLLNTSVIDAAAVAPERTYDDEERNTLQPPWQYSFSINPIPALVILLLGFMMSSHTQHSMTSSMIHKQWGNLLTGASVARGFTYVIIYLKPPTSVLPSRPPTELLAAFGLISGGIIFMASASDTVQGMEHYNLDAMFMYTVTMGLVGLLMAWEIIVLAIKGWAVRKEAGRLMSRRA